MESSMPTSASQIKYDRIHAGNIDPKTMVAHLKGLLGLEVTEELRNNSFIDMKPNEQRAEVLVPSDSVQDILKLNGVRMYEREITVAMEMVITCEPTDQAQTTQQKQLLVFGDRCLDATALSPTTSLSTSI